MHSDRVKMAKVELRTYPKNSLTSTVCTISIRGCKSMVKITASADEIMSGHIIKSKKKFIIPPIFNQKR